MGKTNCEYSKKQKKREGIHRNEGKKERKKKGGKREKRKKKRGKKIKEERSLVCTHYF